MTVSTSTPPSGTAAIGAPSTGSAGPRGSGPGAGRHTGKTRRAVRRPARLSLSNWPVSTRLIAVFMVASVTGLVFGGLRIAAAISTSDSYGRTAQVALVGQQAIVLAQDLENERDRYTGVAAYTMLSGDATSNKAAPSVVQPLRRGLEQANAQLAAAKRITDAESRRVRALASAINTSFPSGVWSNAISVVAMIDSIPELRSQVVGQPALEVIADYSSSIADLFNLTDEITSGSGDSTLADEVRALSALSRAKEEASQQRALVYATLIETSVNDAGGGNTPPSNTVGLQSLADVGGIGSLTTSQGVEAAELHTFNDAATTDQSNDYLGAVAGPADNEATLIEDFEALNGDPRLVFETIGNKVSLGYDRA
jgi:hypothetical protein